MANNAVDARIDDTLAALALNTYQLRCIRVIGERPEHEETASEQQEASAYFAPQRQPRCPSEAHIQRRQNQRGQKTHFTAKRITISERDSPPLPGLRMRSASSAGSL